MHVRERRELSRKQNYIRKKEEPSVLIKIQSLTFCEVSTKNWLHKQALNS